PSSADSAQLAWWRSARSARASGHSPRGSRRPAFVWRSFRRRPSSWIAITPPRGRVASRSGAARGFHRWRKRVQVSVVHPSKRTSGVSTPLRYTGHPTAALAFDPTGGCSSIVESSGSGAVWQPLLSVEREDLSGVLEFHAQGITTRIFARGGEIVFAEAGTTS